MSKSHIREPDHKHQAHQDFNSKENQHCSKTSKNRINPQSIEKQNRANKK